MSSDWRTEGISIGVPSNEGVYLPILHLFPVVVRVAERDAVNPIPSLGAQEKGIGQVNEFRRVSESEDSMAGVA